MGLVKTRRLAAMLKQQRAKAGLKPPMKKGMEIPFPSAWKRNRGEWPSGAKALNPALRGEVDA